MDSAQTDYYIHHQLRAGLARIEGLVHLLQQEGKLLEADIAKDNGHPTADLILQEVKELKQFTQSYLQRSSTD
jgi:hypothetical protein